MSEEVKPGTKKPVEEDRFSYENLTKLRQNSVYVLSILLVINGIMKIATPGEGESIRSFITTFNFCLIGITLMLIELEKGQIQ